jgi:hypothetical protein
MRTLNWRHTDWSARHFIFSIGQEIIGQLSFNSFWNFNAAYTDRETKLHFSQKSFWDHDVLITKDGVEVGEIIFGFFGNQTLKLVTGEKFSLSTSLWEQEAYWKTEKGDTVIKYQQATMSSMGKGLISLSDTLTIDKEKLLIASGLFARQLRHKRSAVIIAIMLPILTTTRYL